MYDPSGQDSAPKVRIRLLGEALERRAEVTWITGGRWPRAKASLRWLLARGAGSVDAAYVELSTSAPTPVDLLVLTWLRLRGLPVGVYFRDAYQRFRDLFPTTRVRHRLADLIWFATLPLVRRLATVAFVPSSGLAEVLGIRRPVLLPPGTDPDLPDLGPGSAPVVGAIATLGTWGGTRLLIDAVSLVRREIPDVRLLIVASGSLAPPVPDWVTVTPGGRQDLAGLLGPVRAVVIPLPLTRYNDLAVPVRLMDLLALGKPIVSTRSRETARLLEGLDAAILVEDNPESVADVLTKLLRDTDLAGELARHARALAISPGWRWEDRARTVLERLLAEAPAAA